MVLSFRRKGLQRYFESVTKAGIQAQHSARLRVVLARLHAAQDPKDLNLPGLRLHLLGGRLDGFYSVMISGNGRVIFRFEGQDAFDVDYLDYH
ncbi:protein killer protein [Geomonas sp. Red276]